MKGFIELQTTTTNQKITIRVKDIIGFKKSGSYTILYTSIVGIAFTLAMSYEAFKTLLENELKK